MWRRVAARLAARYDVRTPDLPGFGSTAGRFTLDGAASAVADLAGAEPAERVHLCGFSLGGAVALRAVSAHPDRFLSLVICAAPLAPSVNQSETLRRYRRIPDRVARLFSDSSSWCAVVHAVSELDVSSDLPQVRVPTLVACGARDRGALADTYRIAHGVPGARLLLVPHLGHGWPVFAPQVFAAVLDGFLSSIPGPAGER